MVGASKESLPGRAAPADAPFRLVFHIGNGKTGTTSIQETLRTNLGELKSRGFWYLGLMLENAPEMKRYPWQHISGSDKFFSLDARTGFEQLLGALKNIVPSVQLEGSHTAVWSNEWFFSRSGAAIDALDELQKSGVKVQIVAYVRRHDAWAHSAYIQFALKNKDYVGSLRPFGDWIKHRDIGFAKCLRPWRERFPGAVVVRNLDAVGDAVRDFLQVVGIGEKGLTTKRSNVRPAPEELVLRTLFNEQFKERVPVERFIRMLAGNDIHYDRPIGRILDPLLPTEEDLKQVVADYKEDRQAINAILAESGQPPIVETPLTVKPMEVDLARVSTAMFQMLVLQAKRIRRLEGCVEKILAASRDAESVKSQAPSSEIRQKIPG